MRLDLSWQSTMHIFYMLLTNWLLSCLVWKPRLGRRIKPLSLIAFNLAFTFIWYCADYLVSRQGDMQVWRGYNCSVRDKNFKTLHHFQAKSFSPCIWLITSTGMNELFSEFNPPTARVQPLFQLVIYASYNLVVLGPFHTQFSHDFLRGFTFFFFQTQVVFKVPPWIWVWGGGNIRVTKAQVWYIILV